MTSGIEREAGMIDGGERGVWRAYEVRWFPKSIGEKRGERGLYVECCGSVELVL